MHFEYKTSTGVEQNFSIDKRIVILKGMSNEQIAEFCSALEKAISSDPLESCDDWDKRNDGAILTSSVKSAYLRDFEASTYGYTELSNGAVSAETSDALVYGVRYIGGLNYSCFTSVTEDSTVEDEMRLSMQANPNRYNRLCELLSKATGSVREFIEHLFADVTRRLSGAKRVLIIPKPTVLSNELYELLAYALASVSEAKMLVLTEDVGVDFTDVYSDCYQYIEY